MNDPRGFYAGADLSGILAFGSQWMSLLIDTGI